MAAPKVFNNVIIGQFVLTGVPIKVYASGQYLTITDADDVEDPLVGFGMTDNGEMVQFSYPEVEFINVIGNQITIDTYNKGMAKMHSGDEAPADAEPAKEDPNAEEDPKQEESFMRLGDILSEITKDEQDAEQSAIDSEEKAAKEKFKAAQAAFKGKLKSLKDREKANKAQTVEEDRDYSGMSHAILAVAAKADGEGMAQIAGMLGVDVGEYDLEDDGDLDDLYDDIETALGRVSTAEVEQLYNELRKLNLVEGHEGGYTFGTGDIIGNKNPGCVHYGSKGIVIGIPQSGYVRYTVTNSGDTYKPGDILTKSMDQLEKI